MKTPEVKSQTADDDCDLCAPDGTITVETQRMLCPVCDETKRRPSASPADSPERKAREAIDTWRREWAEHDVNGKSE